ncbi:MAG: hypothetical protein OXG02_00120 [Chloroflexi bacterium]|nr:hypothetical protein [Chloroflexota bacterium]
MNLQIRRLSTYEDIQTIMPLQRATWGAEQAGGLVPAQMLIHLVRYGGHVLAAYSQQQLVGFIIGYIGLQDGQIVMASKRMVVKPEFRNLGIAMQLKLAQRKLAIEQNVELITWTFSPTMSVNAHFNLNKLGGVAKRYDVNVYGTDTPLSTLGNSDRLLVEYWVNAERVRERADPSVSPPRRPDQPVDAALVLNPSQAVDLAWRIPGPIAEIAAADEQREGLPKIVFIELPTDFAAILAQDPTSAASWQTQLRQLLLQWLNQNDYLITGLLQTKETESHTRRAYYILEKCADLRLSQG